MAATMGEESSIDAIGQEEDSNKGDDDKVREQEAASLALSSTEKTGFSKFVQLRSARKSERERENGIKDLRLLVFPG